jgi:molybdopterin-guanine dinucleotide biosynthesis protein
MKYKHYAPKADMVIVEGDETSVITKIKALTAGQKAVGKRVAVIASDETKAQYGEAQKTRTERTPDAGSADVILSMGSRTDEDSIARHLYHILRECDELNVDVIYSESFSTPRIGSAIMNRLLKAAGHQVIQA